MRNVLPLDESSRFIINQKDNQNIYEKKLVNARIRSRNGEDDSDHRAYASAGAGSAPVRSIISGQADRN